jgi:NTP pyrophosphatase (non-canonical NTP hydrolase)
MKHEQEYKRMLEVWGEEIQILCCIEELGELTQALCKYLKCLRKNESPQKIAKCKEAIREEIADVINTAEQMEQIFGFKEVEEIRDNKIKRTMKMLGENCENPE